MLPLRSPHDASRAGKREVVLGTWNEELEEVQGEHPLPRGGDRDRGRQGRVRDHDRGRRDATRPRTWCCASGCRATSASSACPAKTCERVQYQLDDPDEYSGETIIVVGAGDAGIENALALAGEQPRHPDQPRRTSSPRVKQGNIDLVIAAIQRRQDRVPLQHERRSRSRRSRPAASRSCFTAQTPTGVEDIPCDRVIARLGAIPPRKLVESFGVQFPNADQEAVPQVSATYESNVPGLYIIGALGGYPLIKQAMNQGYEVVEYILGNAVEPADEPCSRRSSGTSSARANVSEALALDPDATCRCSRT